MSEDGVYNKLKLWENQNFISKWIKDHLLHLNYLQKLNSAISSSFTCISDIITLRVVWSFIIMNIHKVIWGCYFYWTFQLIQGRIYHQKTNFFNSTSAGADAIQLEYLAILGKSYDFACNDLLQSTNTQDEYTENPKIVKTPRTRFQDITTTKVHKIYTYCTFSYCTVALIDDVSSCKCELC